MPGLFSGLFFPGSKMMFCVKKSKRKFQEPEIKFNLICRFFKKSRRFLDHVLLVLESNLYMWL